MGCLVLKSLWCACLAKHHSTAMPSTRTRVARMESESTAQLPEEGARCLKKSATLCEEGPLRGWRIWGGDPVYLRRRCWAKRPHFTCLGSQIGLPGETEGNNFNAACGLGPLCWVRGHFFWIVMSCLWYLNPLSNHFKFRCHLELRCF
jgi:hypothetical protein